MPNPYGSAGNPLSNSPPFQANLRARYEFTVGEFKAFWQIGGTHEQEAVTRPRVTGVKFSYKSDITPSCQLAPGDFLRPA